MSRCLCVGLNWKSKFTEPSASGENAELRDLLKSLNSKPPQVQVTRIKVDINTSGIIEVI